MALSDCDAPSTSTPYTYSPTATTTTRGVNIIGTDLAAPTNTVTLTGFTTAQVVVFSKPLVADSNGLLLYDAFSPITPGVGNWHNIVTIYGNNGGSDVQLFSFTGVAYADEATARAAIAATLPFTATGYTTYKVVGWDDPTPSDNLGGLSILVEARTPAWVPQTLQAGDGGSGFLDVVCSENLAAGDLVNLYNNSGVLNARKASGADDTKQPDGYVLSAFSSGWTARVFTGFGTINNAVSGLTVGSRYFLSPSSPGGITATQPSTTGQWSQIVGKANTTTGLIFSPENGFLV